MPPGHDDDECYAAFASWRRSARALLRSARRFGLRDPEGDWRTIPIPRASWPCRSTRFRALFLERGRGLSTTTGVVFLTSGFWVSAWLLGLRRRSPLTKSCITFNFDFSLPGSSAFMSFSLQFYVTARVKKPIPAQIKLDPCTAFAPPSGIKQKNPARIRPAVVATVASVLITSMLFLLSGDVLCYCFAPRSRPITSYMHASGSSRSA